MLLDDSCVLPFHGVTPNGVLDSPGARPLHYCTIQSARR
jgi:hypothetical protein